MESKTSVALYNELFAAAKRVSITAEIITPRTANAYIENNTDNFRTLRPSVANNYARDMENDVWRLSWDCIAFDEDGNLINGQHRLTGIVTSNKPQVCFVMRNCPKDLFFGDTGAKRKTNDYLRRSGAAPTVCSNTGVGALNVMLKCLFSNRVKAPTTFDVQNLLEQLPDLDTFTEIIQIAKSGVKGINTASVVAAVYAAFACTNDERVISFMNELVSGIGQPTVISLRDKLITNAYGSGGTAVQNCIIKVVQRVIKAYLAGEHLTKLYVPTDCTYMLDTVIDLKRGDAHDAD